MAGLMAEKPKKCPGKVYDVSDKKETLGLEEGLRSKAIKGDTDNHLCRFSLLWTAEIREGTEERHGCHVAALGRVGICKIFGVGYVAITFT